MTALPCPVRLSRHKGDIIMTLCAGLLLALAAPGVAADKEDGVAWRWDEASGQLALVIDGREAAVYQTKDVDLPHFYPLKSPSGKPLTVQKTEPYPHHRSVWFGDTVVLDGKRQASTYNALYSQVDKKDPKSPYKDRVRHLEFRKMKSAGRQAEYGEKLIWEMDQTVPLLDEERQVRAVALGKGQYLLDLSFTVTAAYGNVKFTSDGAHYAWPYVRMSPAFSVDKGGRMVNSEGGIDQKGTNNHRARWVDYTNTVDGVTEGLAFFTHAREEPAVLWLTRDYGTFGPRRPDAQNGKPFELKKGESLRQRVGLFIHSGDAEKAEVSRRYQEYIQGKP